MRQKAFRNNKGAAGLVIDLPGFKQYETIRANAQNVSKIQCLNQV